jgi:hypothetical protein
MSRMTPRNIRVSKDVESLGQTPNDNPPGLHGLHYFPGRPREGTVL